MARQTGIKVRMIDLEKLGIGRGAYRSGVIYNPEGHMRTINTEGVADRGFHGDEFVDKFAIYTHTSYIEFSRAEIESALSDEYIDLSIFIRTFGDRLERNFYLAHSWAIGKDDKMDCDEMYDIILVSGSDAMTESTDSEAGNG